MKLVNPGCPVGGVPNLIPLGDCIPCIPMSGLKGLDIMEPPDIVEVKAGPVEGA